MFSVVSVCPRGGVLCSHYPGCIGLHCAEPPLYRTPASVHGHGLPPPLYRAPAPQKHLVGRTGDMFKLVHLRTSLFRSQQGTDIWWLATEACMVGEQVACILLGCFLVTSTFNDLKICDRDLNTKYEVLANVC